MTECPYCGGFVRMKEAEEGDTRGQGGHCADCGRWVFRYTATPTYTEVTYGWHVVYSEIRGDRERVRESQVFDTREEAVRCAKDLREYDPSICTWIYADRRPAQPGEAPQVTTTTAVTKVII